MKYNVTKEEFVGYIKRNRKITALNQQQEQYLDGVINEYCENLTEQAEQNKLDPNWQRQYY